MAPGNSPAYNRNNYKKNRRKILRDRAERYRTDKAYRNGILNRAKAGAVLRKASRMVCSSTVEHDGQQERTYTLSALAEASNRHKTVLLRWRRNKTMPRPTYFEGTKRAKGIYSESQVALIAHVCKLVDKGKDISYREAAVVFHAQWTLRFWPTHVDVALKEAKDNSKGVERGNQIKRAGNKEGSNKKRPVGSSVRSKERGGKAKAKADSKVRRRGSGSSSKPRNNAKHGKLRKPPHRNRSVRTV